jgi:hypothetical protein
MTMTVDKVLYTGQARTRVAGTAHPRPDRTTRRPGWHGPLDLEEVTLVDAEIVRLLGTCEARRATPSQLLALRTRLDRQRARLKK